MALPILVTPTFSITIPSTDKKIKCRTFLVKEEKILLMALETNNEANIVDALKQILNNCVIDWGVHSADTLAIFDLEYLLLKMRAKAKGETIKLKFNGMENSACEKCKKPKLISININDIEVKRDPEHTKTIKLTDEVGLTLKYPQLSAIEEFGLHDGMSEIETIFEMVKSSIESIYDKESVYLTKDCTPEEVEEFVNSLSTDQIEKVFKFFTTMPKVEYILDLSCEVCGRKDVQTLTGINSFFQ